MWGGREAKDAMNIVSIECGGAANTISQTIFLIRARKKPVHCVDDKCICFAVCSRCISRCSQKYQIEVKHERTSMLVQNREGAKTLRIESDFGLRCDKSPSLSFSYFLFYWYKFIKLIKIIHSAKEEEKENELSFHCKSFRCTCFAIAPFDFPDERKRIIETRYTWWSWNWPL